MDSLIAVSQPGSDSGNSLLQFTVQAPCRVLDSVTLQPTLVNLEGGKIESDEAILHTTMESYSFMPGEELPLPSVTIAFRIARTTQEAQGRRYCIMVVRAALASCGTIYGDLLVMCPVLRPRLRSIHNRASRTLPLRADTGVRRRGAYSALRPSHEHGHPRSETQRG